MNWPCARRRRAPPVHRMHVRASPSDIRGLRPAGSLRRGSPTAAAQRPQGQTCGKQADDWMRSPSAVQDPEPGLLVPDATNGFASVKDAMPGAGNRPCRSTAKAAMIPAVVLTGSLAELYRREINDSEELVWRRSIGRMAQLGRPPRPTRGDDCARKRRRRWSRADHRSLVISNSASRGGSA